MKIKFSLSTILVLFLIGNTNGFTQSIRCSKVVYTIGYLYVPSTESYREEVKSIESVKFCMSSDGFAIGEKTTYWLGKAISKKEYSDGTVYTWNATDQKGVSLILETSFLSTMKLTATYPEAYKIVYYVEDDTL